MPLLRIKCTTAQNQLSCCAYWNLLNSNPYSTLTHTSTNSYIHSAPTLSHLSLFCFYILECGVEEQRAISERMYNEWKTRGNVHASHSLCPILKRSSSVYKHGRVLNGDPYPYVQNEWDANVSAVNACPVGGFDW